MPAQTTGRESLAEAARAWPHHSEGERPGFFNEPQRGAADAMARSVVESRQCGACSPDIGLSMGKQ